MDCFQRLIKWWSYWCYESLSAAIKAAFRCLVGGTSFIHLEAANWPCAQTWQPDHQYSCLGYVPYRPHCCCCYCCCCCCCCCCSVAQLCLTLWPHWLQHASHDSLSIPELAQTHVHRVGGAIQPSHPLASPSPPAPNPSQHQGLFQWVNSSHDVAKYWSFSFSISPTKEHPGLISFRIYWFDLLVVQGTVKSLLQHHSSKASIPQHPAFFMVQLSHPYMTPEKAIALAVFTFVSRVMSLLFNVLGWS